jgi:hypothetical protein
VITGQLRSSAEAVAPRQSIRLSHPLLRRGLRAAERQCCDGTNVRRRWKFVALDRLRRSSGTVCSACERSPWCQGGATAPPRDAHRRKGIEEAVSLEPRGTFQVLAWDHFSMAFCLTATGLPRPNAGPLQLISSAMSGAATLLFPRPDSS